MMIRTTFIIDGFNLYHSVKEASGYLHGASTKWLDIKSLCASYLHLIGGNAQLARVYYFSALAKHLQKSAPGKVSRHSRLIECLKATDVSVELAEFKKVSVWCQNCQKLIPRYEEKETDVAIAAKLLEVCIIDECDTVVVMTGDTDLAPAARTARRLFPDKKIWFAFPYRRNNRELERLAHGSFNINPRQYARYQFPDPVALPDGRKIHKPSKW